jgi:hypothetical protein
MSSFKSTLDLEGENYAVLKCSYQFDKPVDTTTKPTGEVRGGRIKLTIESRGNTGLLDWIIAPEKEKDGLITFYKRDAMSRLLEIQFKKAHCIQFKEKFNAIDTNPMRIALTISARTLKFNHLEFHNDWVG